MKERLFKFIQKYLGWRNWALFYYNSIIENIFLFFYIALVVPDYSNAFILKTLCFIGFSLLSTTFGYLINDFADRELDRQHGKSNTFEEDSTAWAIWVLLIVFGFSAIFALPFWKERVFLLLWGLWVFIATFYSLPPLRFKERGKLGLVLVVLAQRVIPALIVFAAFRFWRMPDVVVLLNYILAKGFASDANHQIQDYFNDLKTGTRTSAVAMGIHRLEKYYRMILRYERISLLGVMALIYVRFNTVTFVGIPLIHFLMAVFIIVFVLSWIMDIRYKGVIDQINPFKPHTRDVFQFVHLAFPHVLLPFTLVLILIPKNFFYGGFLFILVALYQVFRVEKLKSIIASWKEQLKAIKE